MEIQHTIQFGGDTDKLAQKVLTGEKTATSSLYDYYLLNLKKMSRVGDYALVIDSSGKDVCTIRIEKVEIVKFKDITELFAREEGDGNLANWLEIHTAHYSFQLEKIGKYLTGETELVCEWFKAV